MTEGKRELPSNFEKLRHVPVFAVRHALGEILGDSAGLGSKTGDELLQIAAETPAFTETTIERLFEEYRYGGRASFYCYLLGHSHGTQTLSIEQLQNGLNTLCNERPANLEHRISILDTELLEHGLVEIRFGYQTTYEFIDPETEMPNSISELRFGFVWLNLSNSYMVLMSKHDEVNHVIVQLIARVANVAPQPVRLTPAFVNRYFNLENIQSAAWHDPKYGVRRRLSGKGLYDVAGNEIRNHEASAQRTSALYGETISDGLTSHLGITLEKGKLYLTRTLAASQLRQWMYSRLHPLMAAMHTLEPAERIAVAGPPPPTLGLSVTGERYFRDIVSAILAKRSGSSRALIPISDNDLFSSMRQLFLEPEVFFFCETCDERSPICCPACEDVNLKVYKDDVKCENCGYSFNTPGAQVLCIRGHASNYTDAGAKLILRPNLRLQETVAEYVKSLPEGEEYNPDEEFFWIEDRELHYIRNSTQVVFLPTQLEEFQRLPKREDIPATIWGQAEQVVLGLKEKCEIRGTDHDGQPRRTDCEECFENNLGRLCSPKLFRALDPTFMPLPHGGQEFGDAPLTVTINGNPMTFIGIIKSGSGKPIQLSQTLGREILLQVLRQAIRDARVGAFGVIVPRILSEELRATIKMLGAMAKKKVLFFGQDEMTHLYAALLLDPAHTSLNE